MNKPITLAAIALLSAASLAGQASPATPSPTNVAQDLRMLERKWVDALIKGDVKTLGEILDDTYTDTDEQGNVTDKAGILAAVKSGDLTLGSIQLSGMKIHSYVYAAVVTGRAAENGVSRGRALAPSVVFTDTFAMINGTWKVVASHRSAPPAK